MVSRELGMPISNVHLRGTSTETVPNANVSGGSVVADLNGLAVKVTVAAVASKSLTPSGPNTWVGGAPKMLRVNPTPISFPHLGLSQWYSTQWFSCAGKRTCFIMVG